MRHKILLALVFTVASVPIARAATFCVGTAAALQTAFTTAGNNGESNTISIRSGTYLATSASGFFYNRVAGSGSLDIEGGWNAGCTTQTPDASLTTLDGQSMYHVMYVGVAGDPQATITVRNLTFLHGIGSNGGAAALNAHAPAELRVENCRFRLNTADTPGSGQAILYLSTDTGPMYFIGNVVANNSALGAEYVAGFDLSAGSAFDVYLNNNTIADNIFDTTPSSAGAVFLSPIANMTLSNNILWGNGGAEFDQNITLHPLMFNNDVDVLNVSPASGSTGNRNQDPQFVNANNHHLQATSPLYNAGHDTPDGGVGALDLDGNPRVQFGFIDIGAYEMQVQPELIFADGFDAA